MAVMSSVRSHFGQWVSVRAIAERDPLRLTLMFTFGELPAGWNRPHGRARTWVGLLGLVCIAPFVAMITFASLRTIGITAPYETVSASSVAILAATLSLFVGIPVAIAINLWRITRLGMLRREGALEGLVAFEFAPLHLFVVGVAVLVAGLFLGHLAADSYACFNGVRSAC